MVRGKLNRPDPTGGKYVTVEVAEIQGRKHQAVFDRLFEQAQFGDKIYIEDSFRDGRRVHTHYLIESRGYGQTGLVPRLMTQVVT